MTFGDFNRLVDVGIPGGIVIGGEFQMAGIGDDRHEVGQGDTVQRTVVVGRHGDIMSLSIVCDFLHLCDTAGPCQVRIEYISCALLQDLLKTPAGKNAFAGCDRYAGTFTYLAQG